MKTLANLTSTRAWLRIQLPAAMLITLLQRTPVVRLIQAADEIVTASPIGTLLRSTLAAAASLGTLHSLAGATTLLASNASPVTITAGSPIAPVAFTVTNTINIASWQIGGTLPPGLTLAATEGGTSLTGPGMLDATTPGMDDGYGGMTGGVASTTPFLSGTPTQPGVYTLSLQAYEFAHLTGLASNTFTYSVTVTSGATSVTPPTVATQPVNQRAVPGASVSLTAAATSNGTTPTIRWQRNGGDVSGGTAATLTLASLQPADAGLYVAQITNSAGTTSSDAAIVGVATTSKVIGTGDEVGADIKHPNGNTFDQILLSGAAATVTADAGQVTRTSFIDLTNDIVQVEFSGAGTLSLVLDSPSGPAAPVNYNQPTVGYMKGHPGIVITGADETTNVSVFTVGHATAFDPTGGFNILLPISATNNPANNGSSLFQGHASTVYDGLADIAFIAISSTNGKFGGLRTSNGSYFATKGMTGVYAPGVAFQGPVFIGDISASDTATPVIIIGSSPDTRITGGDLLQANGQPVKVSGLTQLKFTGGGDSHGNTLSAKTSRAVLQQNGVDVTAQVVVNPSP